MPDRRQHRGPHPEDRARFGAAALGELRAAAADLSWLLARGYSDAAAQKLVGDRFQLDRRQRQAVRRATCTPAQREDRRRRLLRPVDLRGGRLLIDGFNVLTTVEAALAGGMLLECTDGCLRDLASLHGTWRKVEETRSAARRIGALLDEWAVAEVVWLLDRPVGNSGRLAGELRALADEHGFPWQVRLEEGADRALSAAMDPIATADSGILDRDVRWIDLARRAVAGIADRWTVDLTAGIDDDRPAR